MSRALKGGLFKGLLLFSLFVGFLMLVVLLVVTLLRRPPRDAAEIDRTVRAASSSEASEMSSE